VNTVWWFWDIDMIEKYIKNQWKKPEGYKKMYRKQKVENLFGERVYI